MIDGVRRISRLDAAARTRIEAACGFVNAEIRRARSTIVVWVAGTATAGFIVFAAGVDIRIVLGVAGVVIGGLVFKLSRTLQQAYKTVLLPRVVAALGDGISYSEDSSLSMDDFLRMDLFAKTAENFSSEDEIRSRTGEVTYTIHECRATREEGSGEHQRTVTIFRGMILRLDFNKNFNCHTVVVPDSESQILGGLFGESGSRRGKALTKMENPEFENVYSVYSTNDQQARYILTPKLMELMLGARHRLDNELRFAFVDNSVFVAVRSEKNRFEAPMFGSEVTPESALGDFIEVVDLAESVVKSLDLETRIWSRT